MIKMKNTNFFVSENNNLNRDNYGYFANQSHSNWTLRTPRVREHGAYEPNSDKIPVSAWFGSALFVGCIFLAMFL
jgi:hypothetical protein